MDHPAHDSSNYLLFLQSVTLGQTVEEVEDNQVEEIHFQVHSCF